jgi:hypothetical protein
MTRRAFALLPAAGSLSAAEKFEVVLERLSEDRWERLDARTVLSAGERVRFRFTSSMPGWLCVYYTGSGGRSEWLLPSRLIVKDTAYLVPAEPASFTVEGPPGMDILYWILSAKQVPLEALIPEGARRSQPNTMIPRCRQETVQLACLDERAGPSKLRARDLKIEGTATMQPADRNVGVITYEFRMAHR